MRTWRYAGIPMAGSLFLFACTQASTDENTENNPQAVQAEAASCVTIDPARSLFVTDAAALANFSLETVLNRIVATGGAPGQTALGLYRQMLDTLNDKAKAQGSGPHCDDQLTNGAPSINGFPIECPRQEGVLANTNPFGTDGNGYSPVALVNRFDLAPADGSNCGQYRIVFGKNSGKTNLADRMLLIFEAVLPNPNPSAGLAACRAVPQFWVDLSSNSSVSSRASKLASFYFSGLSGFQPVVSAAHYGIGGGSDTGQIRANMFMNSTGGQQWELREFRLAKEPDGSTGQAALIANNTFVQVNPFGGLFADPDATTNGFQAEIVSQVASLASKDVNTIAMSTADVRNAGESDEQDTSNDYAAQARNNASLHSAITGELARIGRSDLTSTNIIDRATTQSCAGCHQISPGRSLGGGLVWPQSNVFTQISENGQLSPALTGTFLPFRARVLAQFLGVTQCSSDAGPPSDAGPGGGNDGGFPVDAGPGGANDGGFPVDAGPPQTDAGSGGAGDGGGGFLDAGRIPGARAAVRRTIGGGIVGGAN